MNSNFEYNQCLARADIKRSGSDRRAIKDVCTFYNNKMKECMANCVSDENERQVTIAAKCLPTVTTDNQLQECIKKHMMESTVNVCKMKCEINAIHVFKNLE